MKKHLINPDACTACTVCVAHCPVAAATRRFAGPKMNGPARTRLGLMFEEKETGPDLCSNCKSCDRACPSGVPVSTLNMLARAKYHETHPRPLCAGIFARGEQTAKLLQAVPGASALMNLGMAVGKATGMTKLAGIAPQAPLPRYASASFYRQLHQRGQKASSTQVVLFPGCYVNYNEPGVGMDAVEVLQHNGIEVLTDDSFVCCGSPLVTGGYLKEAGENAEKNIALIKKWARQGVPVLTCCPSCGLMLKQEYQELFELKNTEYAGAIYDLMEYLALRAEEGLLRSDFGPLQGSYMYHAACHLKAQGFGAPAVELLNMVPGLQMEMANAGCCGISGSYGFKEETYAIAMAVGKGLFEKIREKTVNEVVTDCGTCRLQIAHGSGVRTTHPVSVLRRSYEAL